MSSLRAGSKREGLLLATLALFVGFFVTANFLGAKLWEFTLFGLRPRHLGPRALRERWQNMTPEERARTRERLQQRDPQVRERWQKLSPEERAKVRESQRSR